MAKKFSHIMPNVLLQSERFDMSNSHQYHVKHSDYGDHYLMTQPDEIMGYGE